MVLGVDSPGWEVGEGFGEVLKFGGEHGVEFAEKFAGGFVGFGELD